MRDLEIAEDFQQQGFELGIRLVDFVDQQHAAGGLLQRLQQRPRFDEFLGEEHVAEIVQLLERGVKRFGAAEHFAELVLQDLGVQKLLGVFPLIERLGLVQPLVALQADHLQSAPRRDRLRKLGLADAGWALDQDRLFDLLGEIDRGRDLPARNIALRGEAAFHCLDRGRRPMFSHEFQLRMLPDFGHVLPAFPAKNKPRWALAIRIPACPAALADRPCNGSRCRDENPRFVSRWHLSLLFAASAYAIVGGASAVRSTVSVRSSSPSSARAAISVRTLIAPIWCCRSRIASGPARPTRSSNTARTASRS